MAKTKGEPIKTEQERADEFIAKYRALCEDYGFNLVVTPAFKARDDGTFSVVLQSSVGRLKRRQG